MDMSFSSRLKLLVLRLTARFTDLIIPLFALLAIVFTLALLVPIDSSNATLGFFIPFIEARGSG
jgi:hypothetical protein